MATMLSRSTSPSVVPRVIASIVLVAVSSGSSSSALSFASGSGTINALIRMAAGAPSTDATIRWPATSGMSSFRMVA